MERVLVVPTQLILSCLGPRTRGFHPGLEGPCLALVERHGFFEDRPSAEESCEIKQVIPYGVLCARDAASRELVLLLRRSRRGGDARLHEKSSIGVGGHVNPPDAGAGTLRDAVLRAFERELHEELEVLSEYTCRPIGVLNDDSNPVGQVHVGIVFRVDLSAPSVRVREREQLSGELVSPEAVSEHRGSLETWSSLLLEHLWPGAIPRAVP